MSKQIQEILHIKPFRTVQYDYWGHSKLSEDILSEHIKRKKNVNESDNNYLANNGNSFMAIPKMRKPYFWQFNKMKLYNQECQLILKKFNEWMDKNEMSKK